MNVLIALGNKYFSIPREVLEGHAMPKEEFDTALAAKWKAKDTVFHRAVAEAGGGPDVVGQSDDDDGPSAADQAYSYIRSAVRSYGSDEPETVPNGNSVMGVRG